MSCTVEVGCLQCIDHRTFDKVALQVLHKDYIGDTPYLYVTDYTCRPDLCPIPPAAWSRGLEGRIVKVMLYDQQCHMAEKVDLGGFYTIRNLRLKKSPTGNGVQGRLGGSERLIDKLKTRDTVNEGLQALFSWVVMLIYDCSRMTGCDLPQTQRTLATECGEWPEECRLPRKYYKYHITYPTRIAECQHYCGGAGKFRLSQSISCRRSCRRLLSAPSGTLCGAALHEVSEGVSHSCNWSSAITEYQSVCRRQGKPALTATTQSIRM